MGLNTETAHALSARLQSGEITSREITSASLDRIAEVDGDINAFITVDTDGALAQADAIDQKRASGEALGPLAGIPVALKDVLCVQGGRTTCGSRILEDYVAPYDATSVERLREAGMVFLGKTNMDEFAMGSSNENCIWSSAQSSRSLARARRLQRRFAAAVAADETIVALVRIRVVRCVSQQVTAAWLD